MGMGTAISYQAPPTNVFAYDANSTAGTWTATTQSALDDCGKGKVWSVVGTAGSTFSSVEHSLLILDLLNHKLVIKTYKVSTFTIFMVY